MSGSYPLNAFLYQSTNSDLSAAITALQQDVYYHDGRKALTGTMNADTQNIIGLNSCQFTETATGPTPSAGNLSLYAKTDDELYIKTSGGAETLLSGGISSGGSSTDNAVVRWNGTTGLVVQDSNVIIDDNDNITGVDSLTLSPSTALGISLNPFDTGAGETSELRFLELVANGSNYISFKSPDAITSNSIYTLSEYPSSSGDMLTSDTSGVLSWSTPITNSTGSSTDNAIVRFDSTTGNVIQNSTLVLNDSGNILKGGFNHLVQINSSNYGFGHDNLHFMTTGTNNLALGHEVLTSCTGSDNIGIGSSALASLVGGIGNIAIGVLAGTNYTGVEDTNILIGNAGIVGDSGVIRIGSTQTDMYLVSDLDITPNSAGAIKINPFDTGVGETGEIRFLELVANGSNYIGFRSPDSVSSNSIYTLAEYPSSSGDMLTSTTAGVLSWSTPITNSTGSSTDNAIVRFDSTTGNVIQNGVITISDDGYTWQLSGNNLLYIGSDSTNVGLGYQNLANDDTNIFNTVAIGYQALNACVSDGDNTAVGYTSLVLCDGGSENTAVGSQTLVSCTTGGDNTCIGYGSGNLISTGSNNVAVGALALDALTTNGSCTAVGYNCLTSNTSASMVGVGFGALASNTSGTLSTAVGFNALFSNVTAVGCTALGYNALYLNTANYNTGIGLNALSSSITAVGATAVGAGALQNSDGVASTAVGYQALQANTSGFNIGIGYQAGLNITSGSDNVVLGNLALDALTTGTHNIAIGRNALSSATTSSDNVAIGYNSQILTSTGASNTSIGASSLDANTTGSSNTCVGLGTLTFLEDGDNNVAVGRSALFTNVNGGDNVAMGYFAGLSYTASDLVAIGHISLQNCSTGVHNTGCGRGTLNAITTGQDCTAVGYNSLVLCTGSQNTAVGSQCGDSITDGTDNNLFGFGTGGAINSGSYNVAMGSEGCFGTATSAQNCVAIGYACLSACNANMITAVGSTALESATSGTELTAVGFQALNSITTNSSATAVGYNSLQVCTGGNNTALGANSGTAITTATNNTSIGKDAHLSLTTGGNNIALGSGAGSNLSGAELNNIHIGDAGQAGDANKIRIAGANYYDTYLQGHQWRNRADSFTSYSDADHNMTTAEILSYIIYETPTATRTLTLPSAATLITTDLTNPTVDDCIEFCIINQDSTNNLVLSTSETTIGSLTVLPNISGRFLIILDNVTGSSEAYRLIRIG